MITTLTLNPAIDRTLIIEDFAINSINRVKSIHIDAGGKGINASKVIKSLGESTTAIGILGGAIGKELTEMLEKLNLAHDFVWVEEKTRTNIKVVDILNNTCTDINEAGPYVTKEKLEELYNKVKKHAEASEIMIFSGNAQDSIPITVYKDLIQDINCTDTKIILDASGELLKEGIKAIPWLVKPNVLELSEMLGKDLKNLEEIIEECRKLNGLGIQYVCVSMGSDGLLLVTKDNTIMVKPPEVVAKSTVGAGDSVVGSLAVSLLRNEPLDKALKQACAISAASVTLSGTEVPDEKLVKEIYEKIEIIIREQK